MYNIKYSTCWFPSNSMSKNESVFTLLQSSILNFQALEHPFHDFTHHGRKQMCCLFYRFNINLKGYTILAQTHNVCWQLTEEIRRPAGCVISSGGKKNHSIIHTDLTVSYKWKFALLDGQSRLTPFERSNLSNMLVEFVDQFWVYAT